MTPTRCEDLALYVGAGCGYCEDVRVEARALGLEIVERDAWTDPEHRRDLQEARGRGTVPVLRIQRPGDDEWMGESADIIAYLRERCGAGEPSGRRWGRWAAHRGTTWTMWALLVAGGFSPEPVQSALWTLACLVASARSVVFAVRTRRAYHWGIGAAFATGAASIALRALGVADIPWWYVAFGVTALVLVGEWVRRRRARA